MDRCEGMCLRQDKLTVVVRTHHDRYPLVVTVKPPVISCELNDARLAIDRTDLDQLSWESHSTLLLIVLEA